MIKIKIISTKEKKQCKELKPNENENNKIKLK